MRITLIGPVYPYRGGIAHYTAQLANQFIAAGHETQVISFRRQYPAWLYPGKSDRDPSADPVAVCADYVLDPLYPWTWWQAGRAIAGFRPQGVVMQWWTTFWAPAFSALGGQLRRRGLPVIYLIHNVLPHEERVWDRGLARLALSRGTGFLVHTEREKERVLGLLPGAKVRISPIPIYDGLAQPALDKTEARRLLNLPLERPLLLAFGIVRPYKGLSVLLDALGKLHEGGQDFLLLIAGEFWDDKRKYLRQIEQLGLASHVRIEDRYLPDEEVNRIFAAADVLVAPYTGGTQSAVASWGLSAGLPLIVSDKVAEGIHERHRHLVTITPAGDHLKLAEAIVHYLKGQPQTELSENVREVSGWDGLLAALFGLFAEGGDL